MQRHRIIVIGMIDLESVRSRRGDSLDQIVAADASRVSDSCGPPASWTSAQTAATDGAVRGTNAGRPSPIQRSNAAVSITCPARARASAICGRPTDRPSGLAAMISSTSIGGPSSASRRASSRKRPDSIGALRDQGRVELLRLRIEEIAEHVNVTILLERCDLDPGDARQAVALRSVGGVREARHRVVIRDAEGADAGEQTRRTSSDGSWAPSDARVCR